jgi:hypothetical protein
MKKNGRILKCKNKIIEQNFERNPISPISHFGRWFRQILK